MPRNTQTIGIIGAGVVGGALLQYLREHGHDVAVYDPPKGSASVEALDAAGIVFVCVPTPYDPKRGFDDSHLLDAVRAVPGEKTVVIKSTVLPGTTELLQQRFPQHRFLFNPEFLREATAMEDFVHADRQIVGYTDASRQEAPAVMALLPRAPFERVCRAREAEMAKYAANSFLAVKVSYANEVYDLCERLGVEYAAVRDMVGADARIAVSHLDVFAGGYRGYGGKCLPKDSRSLLDLARTAGVELQVLAAADRVNRLMLAGRDAPRRLQPVSAGETAVAERAA